MATTRSAPKKHAARERARYSRKRSDPQWVAMEAERHRALRHRKRLASQMEHEAVIALQAKVERLEKALARKEREVQDLRSAIDLLQGKGEQDEDLDEIPVAPVAAVLPPSSSILCCEEKAEEVRSNPTRLKECTGCTRDEFARIASETRPHWEALTSTGEPRTNIWSCGAAVSFEAQLLMTLIWLRISPPLCLLAFAFSRHSRDVARYIKRSMTALGNALKGEIQWPTPEEWSAELARWNPQLPAHIKRCVSVVDGTEVRICRPSIRADERKHYSPKKKQHMLNFPVVCLLWGKIIFVGKGQANPSDQSIWNGNKLRERYERQPYGILGDGAYTFNRLTDDQRIYGAIPHKKQNGGRLTDEQKKENRKLSQYRVVVENVIGVMKTWRILGKKYAYYSTARQGMVDPNIVVQVVAALANRRIKERPLRPVGWRPED